MGMYLFDKYRLQFPALPVLETSPGVMTTTHFPLFLVVDKFPGGRTGSLLFTDDSLAPITVQHRALVGLQYC